MFIASAPGKTQSFNFRMDGCQKNLLRKNERKGNQMIFFFSNFRNHTVENNALAFTAGSPISFIR